MQRIVHQLDLTVLELYLPSQKEPSQSLSVLITLRDSTFKSQVAHMQFPMDAPVIFEEERLVASDFVRIIVINEEEELGRVEFLLRDLFKQSLEGDVEAWLKLAERTATSEREDPSRPAQLRLEVNIREVAKKDEEEQDRPRRVMPLSLPEGNDHCERCEYLQKLTAAQQNELQSKHQAGLEESEKSFNQVSFLLEKYLEEQPSVMPEGDSEEPQSQPPAVTAQEAEHLRIVIVSLNEKLKSLQAIQSEVRGLRAELSESHERRKQLEKVVVETTEQLKKQSERQSEIHSKYLKDREAAMNSLRQQHQKYREKCQEEDRLLSDICKLKATLQRLNSEAANQAQMKSHIDAVRAEMEESERQRIALKQQMGKSAAELDARGQENAHTLAKLSADKSSLQSEVAKLQAALQSQQRENEKTEWANEEMRDKAEKLERNLETVERRREELEKKLQETDSRHDTAVEREAKLQSNAGEFGRRLDEILYANQRLREDKLKHSSSLNNTEGAVEQKNEQIQSLILKKLQLTEAIATLEELLCVQEDAQHLADTVTAQNQANTALRDQMLRELAMLSQSMLTQSEQSLATNRLVARLQEHREDKEAELQSLRSTIATVTSRRAMYRAIEGDEVDEEIEKFVNSRSEEMQVHLRREEQETYIFGSRRVYIQLSDGQLMVRVGGGVMPLNEFIDTYTPLERDKIEWRETEQTTRHQILTKKMLGKETTEEATQGRSESSPRKKLQNSPSSKSPFSLSVRRSLSPGQRVSLSPQHP